MKTFTSKEKRRAPAACKSYHYVHHPMGHAQKVQQGVIRKILQPDEVHAKPDIGEPDGIYGQQVDHVANRVAAHLLSVPVRLFSVGNLYQMKNVSLPASIEL